MKNLENHDIDRIAKYVKNDSNKIKNWTAFNFFQKGCVMLYMGEEYSSDIKPTLFDKELYNKNEDISDLIKKLTRLKKKSIFAKGIFTINVPEIDGVAHNVIENDKDLYIGVFNVGLSEGEISINIPDGHYRNYLTGKIVKVLDGKIKLIKEPIILRLKK
jgi:glycosidase